MVLANKRQEDEDELDLRSESLNGENEVRNIWNLCIFRIQSFETMSHMWELQNDEKYIFVCLRLLSSEM
jgi:hypothetical protein